LTNKKGPALKPSAEGQRARHFRGQDLGQRHDLPAVVVRGANAQVLRAGHQSAGEAREHGGRQGLEHAQEGEGAEGGAQGRLTVQADRERGAREQAFQGAAAH